MSGPAAHLSKHDWTVDPIANHGDAVRLIHAWHYSRSAPRTSTYRHGLYRRGVTLCGDGHGVAMWIPPIKAAARKVAGDEWEGVLCLSRLVVDPALPTNAASFLLGRSMRLIDRRRWPWLLTFADKAQGHTGAIYLATNWEPMGETPAGDVWVSPSGQQRGRKRGGRTLLAEEMRAQGFVRAPDAKKLRFVHGPPVPVATHEAQAS